MNTNNESPAIPAGYKPWSGGECPEDALEMDVQTILRNGFKFGSRPSFLLRWSHRKPEDRGYDYDIIAYRVESEQAQPAPIPMILYCPLCGTQHIDAPDDRTAGWDNPPHRSHLCHGCGCIWRPADVATVGVAKLETRGKADTFDPGKPIILPREAAQPSQQGEAEQVLQLLTSGGRVAKWDVDEARKIIASTAKHVPASPLGRDAEGVEGLKTLRALAARCDNNPTEEKEVMQIEVGTPGHPQPATKPPASEAGGDQPAGEPVPLPEPFAWISAAHVRYITDRYGTQPDEYRFSLYSPRPESSVSTSPLYTADQLRTHREEYAETVATPLRERLKAMEDDSSSTEIVYDLAVRLQTAERERDAEKAFADDYRAQLQQAISERDEARRDAARFVWQFHEWQKPQSPHNQAVLAAYRTDDIDAVRAAIDSAMGDSKTTVENQLCAPTGQTPKDWTEQEKRDADAAMAEIRERRRTTVADDVTKFRDIVDGIQGKS